MYSTGDRLPESTGDDASTPWGSFFRLCWENFNSIGGVLYSAGEHSYTLLGNIKTAGDIKPFLVLMVDQLCLGKALLIHSQLQVSAGESYLYCLTLRGVNVTRTRAKDMTMACIETFLPLFLRADSMSYKTEQR